MDTPKVCWDFERSTLCVSWTQLRYIFAEFKTRNHYFLRRKKEEWQMWNGYVHFVRPGLNSSNQGDYCLRDSSRFSNFWVPWVKLRWIKVRTRVSCSLWPKPMPLAWHMQGRKEYEGVRGKILVIQNLHFSYNLHLENLYRELFIKC